MMHDAGKSKFGAKDHGQTGARIVLDDRELPLSASQRRRVAYLVRYHGGAVPAIGRDEILQRKDRRRKTRVLLALLRAADGLDSHRIDEPGIVARLQREQLTITCIVAGRTTRTRRLLRRKAKFDLLKKCLKLRVKLRIVRAGSIQSST